MKTKNYIQEVRDISGSVLKMARACERDPKTVRRWIEQGRLPYTDHAGQTDYADTLSKLVKRKVTKKQLLDLTFWNQRQKNAAYPR